MSPVQSSPVHLSPVISYTQFAEAQQETSKAWLLVESIATASP